MCAVPFQAPKVSKPTPPPLPPEAPPAPTAADSAAAKARRKSTAQGARKSLIKTTSQGDLSSANTEKKSLLGE